MPRSKMIPPLPDTGGTPHDRFKRFAKAILAVPKTEITLPQETLSELEAEKRKVEAQLAAVRLEIAKRKAKAAQLDDNKN